MLGHLCKNLGILLLTLYLTPIAAAKTNKTRLTPPFLDPAQFPLTQTFVIGAMGDSVTTATNVSGWGSKPQYSWSTGESEKVESHWLRLSKQMQLTSPNTEVQGINVADSGARAKDLIEQAEKLNAATPHYVTVLIGANDVCSWKNPDPREEEESFKKDVEASVQSLIKKNDGVKVLLVPIPNMHALWEIGKNQGCQWMWDLFNVCPSLLSSSQSDEGRQLFIHRWNAANKALSSIAANHPQHIKFAKDVSSIPFAAEHVSSRDCFHPSIAGQKLISESTWTSSWFN